jgi:hypothetical protein
MGATVRLDKIIKGSFPGEMLLAIGYNQGFSDGVNNTTFPLPTSALNEYHSTGNTERIS